MSWQEHKIGDFLIRSKEAVKINPKEDYTLVTIRMYHKGVAKRSEVKGSFIKSPTLYKIKGGQFILSGIDARNGAFGIVPDELNGAIVTNDFWTHDIDTSIINIEFFYWFTTTPQFYDACIKASEGTTNRQRLQADKFYSFPVFLPSLNEQVHFVKRITSLKQKHEELNKELDEQQSYLQLLRQTILQEAVQGKLTKQGKTDEPATELLKHIKAEKQKLIKEGKLKKEKELPPITEDEIPFELPKGWVWCRLGEIVSLITKGSSPKWQGVDYVEDGLLFITSENVDSYKIDLSKRKYVDPKFNEIEPRSILKKGDYLMNIVGGSIGRTAIYDLDEIANINQAVCLIRKETFLIDSQFLLYFFNSTVCIGYMFDKQVDNARPNLSMGNIAKFLIPLAPLSEQQHIVTKVQQLQQQLNKLETQVQQSRQYAQQLLQAVLKEAFEVNKKEYANNEQLTMAAEE